jgi:CelD/BcsL family acetyltransferase involved in cellulose biosynthesis
VLTLERVPLDGIDPTIEALRVRNVFHTREWIEYVVRTQRAEPVVAHVKRDGELVGAFTGLIVRRFGVRILGSPFQGWMTGPMGFSLVPGVDTRDAMEALPRFAFKSLRCLHVEVLDRHARFEELQGLSARLVPFSTYELDLTRDEETLFAGLSSACRRAVRKSEKVGVQVEEAHGVEFAEEFYPQLLDVFAKQGRRPPFGVERVREMIRCVEPSGNLLMLRAVSAEGERIATGIFPVHEDFAYFWSGASWRSHQILRPNDALFWSAIRRLKERGIPLLDLGGGGDYKRKFGASERSFPFMRRSMVPGMLAMRDLAASLYKRRATRAPSPARDGGMAQRGPTPFPRATAGGLRPRGEVAESPAERDPARDY